MYVCPGKRLVHKKKKINTSFKRKEKYNRLLELRKAWEITGISCFF